MHEGIYEALATTELVARLRGLAQNVTAEFADVEAADQPHAFARHLGSAVGRALRDIRDAPSSSVGKIAVRLVRNGASPIQTSMGVGVARHRGL